MTFIELTTIGYNGAHVRHELVHHDGAVWRVTSVDRENKLTHLERVIPERDVADLAQRGTGRTWSEVRFEDDYNPRILIALLAIVIVCWLVPVDDWASRLGLLVGGALVVWLLRPRRRA